MTFRLLSCDGGGIRGYISSTLIKNLDTATNGKLLANVNGYAGTSTGGLISIALGAGVSIDTLVDIYTNDAAEIFTKNTWFSAENSEQAQLRAELGEQAELAGPGFFECEYTSAGLHKLMSKYLGQKTFGDVSGRMIAVNSAQLENTADTPARWSPATLNNMKVGADYSGTSLVDAALATSAAPTYFPPHQIGSSGYFADGGTFANNPVLNGVEVALSSGMAGSLADIQVISIGTGLSPVGISSAAVGNPLDWGATTWLWPKASSKGVPALALLNLTMSLSAENAGGVTERLLGGNLVRVNPVLAAPVPLDGYSKQDYQHMDAAIKAAMAGPEWQKAINLINGW